MFDIEICEVFVEMIVGYLYWFVEYLSFVFMDEENVNLFFLCGFL